MLYAPLDNEQSPPDELYFERFEVFMEKCLTDIHLFAEREARSFEQTRRDVARWHCNQLFQWQSSSSSEISSRSTEIWTILVNLSCILESLSGVFGVESFLLAVDSEDISNQAFLGGSVRGREFWRGMRGGGESGAKVFKEQSVKKKDSKSLHSVAHEQHVPSDDLYKSDSTSPVITVSSKQSAKNVKVDLYEGVRKALRTVSGIRNAEMKWTNHQRLFTYGVCLVGWPSDIPAKNPSTLKADQNKRLLELLSNGTLKFIKNIMLSSSSDQTQAGLVGPETEYGEDDNEGDTDLSDELFSWAIQYEENSLLEIPEADRQVAHEDHDIAEPSLDVGRPRKRAKFGERIRFEDAIT
ncbi:hypothetical protein J3R30DRAFT_3483044 [Lentinula aciculospora]|uniref:Uncharacterized protein n=1 Tax=Lentinula aciculospora TaxID=153920 RepID=A0A9W9A9Z9_9AGAR|nr:hypothetical protein J3R30DRAFT_3483044 [Lentinula aciculospora]